MAVIIPKKEFEVDDFRGFCLAFDIISNENAGENGTDEELILEELEKREGEKWIVNFIDNRIDGFFKLQLIE
jgi:hypothetical protein